MRMNHQLWWSILESNAICDDKCVRIFKWWGRCKLQQGRGRNVCKYVIICLRMIGPHLTTEYFQLYIILVGWKESSCDLGDPRSQLVVKF